MGAGRSAGAQHSQSLEAWVCHVPGLKVAFPSTPQSVYGALRAAIDDPDPVVVIESISMLAERGEHVVVRAVVTDRDDAGIRQQLANLNDAGQMYGPIIYQKAPIVMRQLETIIGETTFGKGSVQTIIPLTDSSGLRLTTALDQLRVEHAQLSEAHSKLLAEVAATKNGVVVTSNSESK